MPDELRVAVVYAMMPTEVLHELRAALVIDLANITNPDHIAFGEGRIAIIDKELERRNERLK